MFITANAEHFLSTSTTSTSLHLLQYRHTFWREGCYESTLRYYRWCASYVIAAMLVEFNKGFSLSASTISSNMVKISLSFESRAWDWLHTTNGYNKNGILCWQCMYIILSIEVKVKVYSLR